MTGGQVVIAALVLLHGGFASVPGPACPSFDAPVVRMRRERLTTSGWDVWVRNPEYRPSVDYDFTQRSAPLLIYGTKHQIAEALDDLGSRRLFISASHDRSGQHEDRLIDEYLDPDVEVCFGYVRRELTVDQFRLALDVSGDVMKKFAGAVAAFVPKDPVTAMGNSTRTITGQARATTIDVEKVDGRGGSGVFIHGFEITPAAMSGYRCVQPRSVKGWDRQGSIYGVYVRGSDVVSAIKSWKNPSGLQ